MLYKEISLSKEDSEFYFKSKTDPLIFIFLKKIVLIFSILVDDKKYKLNPIEDNKIYKLDEDFVNSLKILTSEGKYLLSLKDTAGKSVVTDIYMTFECFFLFQTFFLSFKTFNDALNGLTILQE